MSNSNSTDRKDASAPQAQPAKVATVQKSEKEQAIIKAIKTAFKSPGYTFDPVSLKRAIDLGATENYLKQRLATYRVLEGASRSGWYNHALLQQAVSLGANEQWLREKIQKRIKKRRDEHMKEREEALQYIKETVTLLEDSNAAKGKHLSWFAFCNKHCTVTYISLQHHFLS